MISLILTSFNFVQRTISEKQDKEIYILIENYVKARERKYTILLKTTLAKDIDQLVSTCEWRIGINTAVKGMQKSSASKPGTRRIEVDKIRFPDSGSVIVDARY